MTEIDVTYLSLGEGVRALDEAISEAGEEGRMTLLAENGRQVAAVVPAGVAVAFAQVWDAGYHAGRADEAAHRPVPPGVYEEEDETVVRLAEDQARAVARVITAALDGLDLTTVQRQEANQAIAAALHAEASRSR